jgi:phosphomannomutase/phosphoglucomutase
VLEKALLQAGRDVIDIGLVPTPLLYFATHHCDAGSGVMITGSHNPRNTTA